LLSFEVGLLSSILGFWTTASTEGVFGTNPREAVLSGVIMFEKNFGCFFTYSAGVRLY
tara:strand:- start:156 stop:329 length:174 start_codon:yes stop_codon:yes gene_type:complete